MGVGGKFWDLLKPYARFEGLDFLRDKRVAVDLSYWIVQHETAIKKNSVPKPHLRLTFFRTINLFAKFGAFPVFVVDGTPSPLKSQARLARFYRSTIDASTLPVAEEGILVERNQTFLKCVQECVELLELFGMPVLKAKGEAEALCAQLNSEGSVDACITADSDAFLFGAKCVVKCIRPNTKEPFECYCISDIEAGLGLKRKHLIAMSLLIGNDHDLNGVQGIGLDTALQFVQNFSEDEILNILHKIGNGDILQYWGDIKSTEEAVSHSDESMPMIKSSHCSFCGHPGTKRAHFKVSCEYCINDNNEGCLKKPDGFKCNCSLCNKNRKEKEQKKHENWWIKVCSKIALETNFPNDEIVTMYLCENNGTFTATDGPSISWGSPMTEMLVDFLVYHQPWQPSYIRQKMLPMLSTIYLREMATNPVQTLLCGQYEFDSIHRVKIRYGHQSYVVKWKKAASAISGVKYTAPVDSDLHLEEFMEVDEPNDLLDESSSPQIHVDGDCWFLHKHLTTPPTPQKKKKNSRILLSSCLFRYELFQVYSSSWKDMEECRPLKCDNRLKRRPLTPIRVFRGLICLLVFFFTAFMFLVYFAPIIAIILRMFSVHHCRKATSFLFGLWLALWPFLFEKINRTKMVFSGDIVPVEERVLLMANHRTEVDWMYVWDLALRKGCLGYIKYILKSSLMKLPVFGWGFHILEFISVERNWEIDEHVMRQMLSTFRNPNDPLWLTIFPEGTDFTEEKRNRSQKFAADVGLPVLTNVLLPKTRGFCLCLETLRNTLDAVYDMTIAYKNPCPSFMDNVFGVDPSEVHIHVRRIPVKEIPASETDAAAWLMDAFQLKDQLLDKFNAQGHFPNQCQEKELSTLKCLVNFIVVISLTAIFTYLTLFSSIWYKIYVGLACTSLASVTYFNIHPMLVVGFSKAMFCCKKTKK